MKETRTTTKVWEQYKEMASGCNRTKKTILWIFAVVAAALMWMARKTHLTYNAINVLVYYWLIPASWTFMLDRKLDCQIVTPLYSGFLPVLTLALCFCWIGILLATMQFFSKWCDYVFHVSVDFLNYFNRWGGNYVLNSVIICVAVPLAIYLLLAWYLQY